MSPTPASLTARIALLERTVDRLEEKLRAVETTAFGLVLAFAASIVVGGIAFLAAQ